MARLTALLLTVLLVLAACGGDGHQASPATEPSRELPPALSVGEMAKVAGGGTELGDGGPARSAGLCGPSGFAVDDADRIYIADAAYECSGPGGKTIREVDSNGIITTVAGTGLPGFSGDGGPATSARLSFPVAVAVDADGDVYVSDQDVLRIRKIDVRGTITTIAGTGRKGHSGDGGPARSASLSEPGGLAFDKRGNLYVADGVAVRRIDPTGVITTVAGTGTPGFSGDGGPAVKAKVNAVDVTFDREDNLYLSDYQTGRVRKIDRNGTITTVAGSGNSTRLGDGGPATDASLAGPVGIAVDRRGNLLIAEFDGGRIRRVDRHRTITTVAGGGATVADAGHATDALLSGLWDIAVQEPGTLYFGDAFKGRLYAMRYADEP